MRLRLYKTFLIQTICILLSKVHVTQNARGHKLSVQLQRVECRIYDESSIKSLNCSLRRDNITKEMVLDADLTLAQQINNVKCKNTIVFEHNAFNQKLHELELDICQALSQSFDFDLFCLIVDEIDRVTNLPLQCPLEKDVQYHMRGLTLNSTIFTQYEMVLLQ